VTAIVLYVQIIFGALLRHPGTGIDPTLATLHIIGATISTVVIVVLFIQSRRHLPHTAAGRMATLLGVLLLVPVALGLTAYLVLLDERGMTVASNLQVIVNTLHLVFGALLFSSSVVTAGVLSRMKRAFSSSAAPSTAPSALHIA